MAIDETVDGTANRPATSTVPTLRREEYVSAAWFDLERERIFHPGWTYVAHAGSVPAGTRRVVDIAGQSVIVSRDRAGRLHALANVCRHRGSRLCEPTDATADPDGCAASSIQCPYHAWTYSLGGELLSTPRVERGEIDRDAHGLWAYRAAEWNGLVFVSLATDGPPLEDWLAEHSPDLLEFADLPFADMVCVERTVAEVAANWKIVVENYLECLHCAVVHPELVEIVPVYRTGHVLDPERDDGAVEIANRGNSFTRSGSADLPLTPGLAPGDETLYRGAAVFPGLFVDITGTAVSLTALRPRSADRTVVVGEYLFSPHVGPEHQEAIASVIAFNELVGAQDYAICEAVQHGVASTAFTSGVLTTKDALVAAFDAEYRSAMGQVVPT